jgi:hypothetical protein
MIDSINFVRSAETPEQFWLAQKHLLARIIREEVFISKRRRLIKSLKNSKREHIRLPNKSRERIDRYDALIGIAEISEFHHQRMRNVYRYLCDTLACKVLPKHHIKVMMNNQDPGLMLGKTGQELEVEVAELATSHGCYAILHDLTHCLRMGDVTIKHPERAFLTMECKSRENKTETNISPREIRQKARMKILNELLSTDAVELNKENFNDLARLGMPSQFVEYASVEKYFVAEFLHACQLDDADFRIVRPEPGLVYIVKKPHITTDGWLEQVEPDLIEAEGLFSFSALVGRIDGKNAYVAPITLFDIPNSILFDILAGNLNLVVLVSIKRVIDEFAKHDIVATPRIDELFNISGFELREADGSYYRASDDLLIGVIGPRMIHEVQYGLASLTTAIDNMIGTIQVTRNLPPADVQIEPGTPILTRCSLCDQIHEAIWGENSIPECQSTP